MTDKPNEQISTKSRQNLRIAETLLEGIGSGADPERIAAPFAENLVFEIQGDDGAMPWIGHKVGRGAMIEFLSGLRQLTEPQSFEVDDILANEARAVILGSLRTRIKTTGRITRSQFALILTVTEGIVSRFQMLEDSFDMSKASR